MQSERFAVGLTPLPTASRVAQRRSALRWRLVTTLISLVILVVIVLTLGREWSQEWTIAIVALWVASSVFWITVSIVGLSRAKRDLERISDGVAFYLDHAGIEFVTPPADAVPWARVSAVRLAGSGFGAGPNVVLETPEGRVASVPLSFLDASASVLDSAVRAHSLGRAHLDVKALDRVV